LAGCATQAPHRLPPAQEQQQPPAQRGQVTPLPPRQQPQIVQPTRPNRQSNRPLPPNQPSDISSPAVMSLLRGADKQMQTGDPSRALAIFHRALGIEPLNPFIYQRLAAVRLAQQQYGQVEALASKSNSLAAN